VWGPRDAAEARAARDALAEARTALAAGAAGAGAAWRAWVAASRVRLLDPSDPGALVTRSQAAGALGRLAQTLPDRLALDALAPDEPAGPLLLAEVWLVRGARDRAVAELERAVARGLPRERLAGYAPAFADHEGFARLLGR